MKLLNQFLTQFFFILDQCWGEMESGLEGDFAEAGSDRQKNYDKGIYRFKMLKFCDLCELCE